MPSEFPRSPKLLKGALVVFEARVPIPTNLIFFQYNPETMTRGFLQPGQADPHATSGDAQSPVPPVETFQVSIDLDAADQLERSDPLARATGLHPTLAALELLIYPPSTMLILNKALSLVGTALISPARAPMVLFVWGPARVVPVLVTRIAVTEQAFDPLLNPIRAKVDLGLRALTDRELSRAGVPFDTLGLVRQISKEALARANLVNTAEIGGQLSF